MSEPDRKLVDAYQVLSRAHFTSGKVDGDEAVGFGATAIAHDQAHLAVAILQPLAKPACTSAAVFQTLGLAYRDEQDMEASLLALRRAYELDPSNLTSAFAYAQVLFETARPASDAFAAARRLSPQNPTLIRNSAGALAAEGQQDAAEAILLEVLRREPQWLDGHKTLAALRIAAGRQGDFDASYTQASLACPQSLSVRLAHLHLLSTARDWNGARAVLHKALADFGTQKGLELSRVHIASESGEIAGNDPALFDGLADVSDAGLDVCRLRQALRLGDPARATRIGEPYTGGPMAKIFWPYLSLAWRLSSDKRAMWLDGDPPPIEEFDLDFTPAQQRELTACLQGLHTHQAPFLEQSVHGGTQTSGQLFFRPLQPIVAVRAKISEAVRRYIAKLHPPIEGHPLLGHVRDNPIRFEGSWSVALKGGGHHSTHTHPKGWSSSALYVDVPKTEEIGKPPSGWLSFGEGPPELGLNLSPYQQIAPETGKLVLFPSTLWHRTIPFDQGQRLTIAFDVKLPKRRIKL